jgi:ABC-2 type transport system permease protein
MTPVLLVVRREIAEKLRSKAFWITNALLITLLLVAAMVPALLGDDDPTTVTVAAVGPEAAAVVDLAATLAAGGDDVVVERIDVTDRVAAEDALRAEDVDLAVIGIDEIVGVDEPSGRTTQLLTNARRVVLLDRALATAGVPEADRAGLLSPPPPTLTALDPAEEDEGPSSVAVGTGLTAVFVLYGLLIFYGQMIAQGLVQEKQSRVIEVLLATLRPTELLVGKLVGLGVLGLLQVAGLGLVGYLGLTLAGRETVPAEAVPTLVVAVGFFLLGYALYATIFAMAAAVVARIEDLQSAMIVPIVLLVGSLFLSQIALTDPDGTVALIAAVLPPSAPIAQPLLVALGELDPLRMVVGVVGVLVTTALLVPVAARVHAGAALVTRERISVRDALRRNRD